ncbi:MgtC/SapB family protein [Halobacillus sp. A1]|uniref:MgtC/SapB family protein n=1 Tax=Halobacillus sp. A1 TaxID=2880262 RepID=UPI0020A63DBB|nr:MgtC/SapB family protein [Halobacillus sp. A1]MCP3033246.1 MgtC/SapB family protein [Halobacillus sp. A1]
MDQEYVWLENLDIFLIRLSLALLLAGMIGFERELKNHAAGFRTHILVGVSSCLMMLLSIYGFENFIEEYDNIRFDPSRIPSYVISGIGFLGAGTIIVNGMTVRGLTTAASIWTVAGLGLVIGAGMYGVGILATFLVLLSLIFLNKIERKFMRHYYKNSYSIMVNEAYQMNEIFEIFDRRNVAVERVEIENVGNQTKSIFIQVNRNNHLTEIDIINEISKLDYVERISHKE